MKKAVKEKSSSTALSEVIYFFMIVPEDSWLSLARVKSRPFITYHGQ